MIKIYKNYSTEVLCTFRVCDEELALSNDGTEVSTNFIPIAKAISDELAKLKISNTFSYNDTKGYVNLQSYISPEKCIKYTFELKCGFLSVFSKTSFAFVEHNDEEHEG